jgi:hypothetical protein
LATGASRSIIDGMSAVGLRRQLQVSNPQFPIIFMRRSWSLVARGDKVTVS